MRYREFRTWVLGPLLCLVSHHAKMTEGVLRLMKTGMYKNLLQLIRKHFGDKIAIITMYAYVNILHMAIAEW